MTVTKAGYTLQSGVNCTAYNNTADGPRYCSASTTDLKNTLTRVNPGFTITMTLVDASAVATGNEKVEKENYCSTQNVTYTVTGLNPKAQHIRGCMRPQ